MNATITETPATEPSSTILSCLASRFFSYSRNLMIFGGLFRRRAGRRLKAP